MSAKLAIRIFEETIQKMDASELRNEFGEVDMAMRRAVEMAHKFDEVFDAIGIDPDSDFISRILVEQIFDSMLRKMNRLQIQSLNGEVERAIKSAFSFAAKFDILLDEHFPDRLKDFVRPLVDYHTPKSTKEDDEELLLERVLSETGADPEIFKRAALEVKKQQESLEGLECPRSSEEEGSANVV